MSKLFKDMVERSVIIQPDGSFAEYNKSALLIRNFGQVDEKMYQRDGVEPIFQTMEV